jgi:hypothetical protein
MSKIGRGRKAYENRHGTVEVAGFALSAGEIEAALQHRVVPALRDDEGNAEIEQLLGALATTQFATETLRSALTAPRDIPDWQVGEALAEAYLEDHHDCSFPWPMSRDARNPRASLQGTDSVGFQRHGTSYRIAFGETKTSTDTNCPPGVWNGRSGLKKQLEGLRDSTEIKSHIVVRYLGIRATNGASWRQIYEAAAARYLANPCDVALFGVLVRDTQPNELDVSARAKSLAKGCPTETSISIVVIYLPAGHIPKLPQQVAGIERRRSK